MGALVIGQKGTFSKTITEHDVYSFAGITGDFNSVHVNRVAAEQSMFGGQIAHGMLTASFISTVLGMYMPGPGTIYLSQNIKFLKPVFIGDTVLAQVEIVDIKGDRVLLVTEVYNQKDEKVISGEAWVLYPGE